MTLRPLAAAQLAAFARFLLAALVVPHSACFVARFGLRSPHPPRQFTARAGDVILWHGWLCHTGSANVNASPRVGFFARWVHQDDAGVRQAIPADPWHHWAV